MKHEQTADHGAMLLASKAEAMFPSLRMVRGPMRARRLARVLVIFFFISPFALIFVPWQQSLVGKGRISAYDPVERPQTLEAPIEGRIMAWHVQEGSRVRRGDRIVSLRDPDPNLTSRLADERRAIEERLARSQSRVKSLNRQIESLTSARTEAIVAARNRKEVAERNLEAAKQMVTAAQANVKLAEFDYESLLPLKKEGLVAEIDLQNKRRLKVDADAKRVAATQAQLAAEFQVQAAVAEFKRVSSDTDAGIQAVRALQQAAEVEVAAAERDIAQIRVRQARQETQEVTAPIDGTVFRVLALNQANPEAFSSGDF
ncbi:MAG: biotin/lipoyl-binding protein [Planctomycetes bacterium]|nr:biotin/lipoyl-binding protein [Planctomycetota bacterium]